MTGGELSARTEAEKYREWAHRDLVAAGIIQSLLDALDAAEARVAAVEAEREAARESSTELSYRLYSAEQRAEAAEAEVARLAQERAEVESILDAMGDPTDPTFLHPQAASLMIQIRAALGGTA